jgi:putative component of membrane protein insertase Oxa1/YidC/SpoIIIJ protein YidD
MCVQPVPRAAVSRRGDGRAARPSWWQRGVGAAELRGIAHCGYGARVTRGGGGRQPAVAGLLLPLLGTYQRRISPLLQEHTTIRCVYEPSCSEYMRLCIEQWGAARGVRMGMGRLFRCRPGYGGFDYPRGF